MELLSSVASHRLPRALRLGGLLVCCAFAAACGQKGALMLPTAAAPASAPAPTSASATASGPAR